MQARLVTPVTIDLEDELERQRYARVLNIPAQAITDRTLLYLTTYAPTDAIAVSLWRALSVNDDSE